MNRLIATSALVVGAGVLGIWQALLLSKAGFKVRLIERSPEPFADTASRYAGAMIAPYCEAEKAPTLVREYGLHSAHLWREHFHGLTERGSIVVAHARDRAELRRFARQTTGHRTVGTSELATLEPDIAKRFATALYFPDEAHMTTPTAMRSLLDLARAAGAEIAFGETWPEGARADADWLIDCRGIAARPDLKDLRGVRGERVLIRTQDVSLSRPVRLLHPRQPLYVVPWSGGDYDNTFMVGATVIESSDDRHMTVRSALELLGLTYALHPGFSEAEILDIGAGIRPAFPDNVPRVIVDRGQRVIRVNGAYRHGFLLSPVLAEVARDAVAGTMTPHPLRIDI